ncbi:cysteine desulfurase family protein [Demequina lutea]|uniref:Cysteine desulfurase n=1 Tax=Demequina lutea TaxID=431489 RepID=A0A7Y9ZBI1_9MICO|nr:cysteine desulfurase family protein [Demequina lutea]NYI42126.1 cysteine desulfurase [Demequina lutea]
MRHYLDHAATTPMRPAAREAWLEASEEGGNPSSLHAAGRQARARLEDARERIAASLGAHPTEVVFTSGATEANNLAIKGGVWASIDADPGRRRLVTTQVEHHASLDPARWLAVGHQVPVVELAVDATGLLGLDALAREFDGHASQTALVSVQWVNNEVGTVQPIGAVVALATSAGVPVHSDAAQAIAYEGVDFAASGLATMAVSAHKFGGPVGVGALVARRDVRLVPLNHGGGQERRVRSGTLDVPGAVAFAVALEQAVATREVERARLTRLATRLIEGVGTSCPTGVLSGPEPGTSRPTSGGGVGVRAPHIVHFAFPGANADALLYGLDSRCIDASQGSACTAGVVQASHVLIAMGRSEADATSTIRFSLGWTSTEADVDAVIAVIPEVVERARR